MLAEPANAMASPSLVGGNFKRLLSTVDSQRVQADVLHRIIRQNENCEYGRRHVFTRIASVREFQEAVPLCGYEDLRADIDRMVHGASGVLVSEAVRRYFLTSGSSASPKYIPVTTSLIREKWSAFQKYWNIVRHDYPEIAKGVVVANFTDGSHEQITPGGALCSSESSFWNAWSGRQSNSAGPLPKAVLNIGDADARYYTIARLLLETDITALMSLNPSTILRLFQIIGSHSELLRQDIRGGGLSDTVRVDPEVRDYVIARYPGNQDRAAQLNNLGQTAFAALELWPNLRIVICWRSPMLRPYVEMLQPYLDGIPQRDYIAMASEGITAIPFENGISGGALAIDTHFYEFIPEEYSTTEHAPTLLAHELERGRNYVVIMSTSAGLYRYDIGDVVRVRDFIGTVPIVEFLHRTGRTCSLTGEKLTEDQVSLAVSEAAVRVGVGLHTFTLCPVFKPFPHYALIAELQSRVEHSRLCEFILALDSCLARTNLEYRSKRTSRRLEGPEVWVLPSGSYARLCERRIAAGVSDAQIKLPCLTRDPDWHQQFNVVERIACESQT